MDPLDLAVSSCDMCSLPPAAWYGLQTKYLLLLLLGLAASCGCASWHFGLAGAGALLNKLKLGLLRGGRNVRFGVRLYNMYTPSNAMTIKILGKTLADELKSYQYWAQDEWIRNSKHDLLGISNIQKLYYGLLTSARSLLLLVLDSAPADSPALFLAFMSK